MKNKAEIFLFQILILMMLLFFTYIGIKNNLVIGIVLCILADILWIGLIALGIFESIFRRE
jgi:hypothetical protein